MLLFLAVILATLANIFAFTSNNAGSFLHHQRAALRQQHTSLQMSIKDIEGVGKIVCTGLVDEQHADNFMLELLHQQKKWKPIKIVSPDMEKEKKLFLTRNARYSGVLDSLEFEEKDTSSLEGIKAALGGADAWIAMNAPKEKLSEYADAAISSGMKRVIIVSKYGREEADAVGEAAVAQKMEAAGLGFTLLRVDGVVEGEEGGEYQLLMPVQTPLEEGFVSPVRRGNLNRVVAEALTMPVAEGSVRSLTGPDIIGGDWLKMTREQQTERRKEVADYFTGKFSYFYMKAADFRKNKMPEQVQRWREKKEGPSKAQLSEEAARLKSMAEFFQMRWEANLEERQDREQLLAEGMAHDVYKPVFREKKTDMGQQEFSEKFGQLPEFAAAAKEIREFCDESFFLYTMKVALKMTPAEYEEKFGALSWKLEDWESLMEQEWDEGDLGRWNKENAFPAYVHFPKIITKERVDEVVRAALERDPALGRSDKPSGYHAFKDFEEQMMAGYDREMQEKEMALMDARLKIAEQIKEDNKKKGGWRGV